MPKTRRWKDLAERELSEDAPFGIGTIGTIVEQSTLENRPRGV